MPAVEETLPLEVSVIEDDPAYTAPNAPADLEEATPSAATANADGAAQAHATTDDEA